MSEVSVDAWCWQRNKIDTARWWRGIETVPVLCSLLVLHCIFHFIQKKFLNWPKTTLLQRMTYYNSFLSPITSYSLIIKILTPIIIDIYWFMFLFSHNTFSHINIIKYTCILTHQHTCIHLYTHLLPLSTIHCLHPKLI